MQYISELPTGSFGQSNTRSGGLFLTRLGLFSARVVWVDIYLSLNVWPKGSETKGQSITEKHNTTQRDSGVLPFRCERVRVKGGNTDTGWSLTRLDSRLNFRQQYDKSNPNIASHNYNLSDVIFIQQQQWKRIDWFHISLLNVEWLHDNYISIFFSPTLPINCNKWKDNFSVSGKEKSKNVQHMLYLEQADNYNPIGHKSLPAVLFTTQVGYL